jgi:hypothetical protein
VSLFFVFLLFTAQAVAPPQSPAPATPATATPATASPAPQNATPAKPTIQPSPDPASSHFLGTAGILLVAIKPTAIADYELVIRTLQEAMAKDADPIRSEAARGWRVFKSETDAKGNPLYIHVMLPAVTGFDYRPSLLLDELVKDLAPDLLSKYQDAFASPPTKLNLTEFAHMSVAPLPVTPPPDPTKKPPGQ